MKIPEIEATQCGGISAKPRTEGRPKLPAAVAHRPATALGHGARAAWSRNCIWVVLDSPACKL